MVFTDEAELISHLRSVAVERACVIAIDGVDGAGKSTVAVRLAESLNCGTALDVDSFLEREQEKYVGALRIDLLRQQVQQRDGGPVVLAGICMREVLDRIGLQADLHVYVKRMAVWGWADEDEVEGLQIDEIERLLGSENALKRELKAYHSRFKPHLRADVTYERLDRG